MWCLTTRFFVEIMSILMGALKEKFCLENYGELACEKK